MKQELVVPGASSAWEATRSGLIVPEGTVKRRPTCIDLFSGCGGFSLGMRQAGFEVVAALEWDEWAAMTYLVNLGAYPLDLRFVEESDRARFEKALQRSYRDEDKAIGQDGRKRRRNLMDPFRSGRYNTSKVPGVGVFFFGDARKVKGQDFLDALGMQRGEVDCVVGGPPCQGFSTAGRRNVEDPRNSLVFEFARLVLEIMPRTMVMENVPAMLTMKTPDGLPVIDVLTRVLQDGDFATADAIRASLTGHLSRRAYVGRKSGPRKAKKT